jgi:hypothetical protein
MILYFLIDSFLIGIPALTSLTPSRGQSLQPTNLLEQKRTRTSHLCHFFHVHREPFVIFWDIFRNEHRPLLALSRHQVELNHGSEGDRDGAGRGAGMRVFDLKKLYF